MNILYSQKRFKYLLLVIFLSFIIGPVYIHAQNAVDTIYNIERNFTAEDLIRGERLFYGLAYPSDKSVNCVRCHNTSFSDTLNWNPDALVISSNYLNKSPKDLSGVLINPRGIKIAEVHKDFQLTPEDIILIKAYMDEFVNIGLKQSKPVITNLLLFIITFTLFLLSTFDIVFFKILKRQWINKIIIPVSGVIITYILVVNAINLGRSRDYAPDQPIKFSHLVHSGQNQINCLYCHSNALDSKSAGIPSLNVCMNCHLLVRSGTRSGITEISEVVSAYENKQSIEWIRVHYLPDFVFFSHAQHAGAGKISCQTCHGEVEKMHILKQVPDLSMGWCLDCHDSRAVDFSNEYYKTYYSAIYDSMQKGTMDSVMVSDIGGRDCGRCHY